MAEVLAASAIILVALVSVAAALHYARSAIQFGGDETAAVFLAEHKLEHLKALALVDWTDAGLAPRVTTEYCPPSGSACRDAPTPGHYRRTTSITDSAGGACTATCKLARVTVFYRTDGLSAHVAAERRVEVVAMFVSRA